MYTISPVSESDLYTVTPVLECTLYPLCLSLHSIPCSWVYTISPVLECTLYYPLCLSLTSTLYPLYSSVHYIPCTQMYTIYPVSEYKLYYVSPEPPVVQCTLHPLWLSLHSIHCGYEHCACNAGLWKLSGRGPRRLEPSEPSTVAGLSPSSHLHIHLRGGISSSASVWYLVEEG